VLRHEGRPVGPGWSFLRTTTDTDGTFVLHNLPAEKVTLVARHAAGDASEVMQLVDGTTHSWYPLLGGPLCIRGRLRSADGTPLPDFDIVVTPPADPALRTTTDTEGRFAIEGCTFAPHALAVRRSDSALPLPTEIVADVWPAEEPLELTVPETLIPSASLRGTLCDADGRPVADARVTLIGHGGGAERLVRVVDAGSDGAFHIAPLPPTRYGVAANSPATGVAVLVDVDLGPNDAIDLGVLRFERPGSLEVEVVDADGTPSGRRFLLIRRPGQVWNASVRLAGGRGGHTAIQPGRWYATLWDGASSPVWREFDIVPGADTRIEMRARPGTPCLLRFPPRSTSGVPLTFTLRDATGEVLFEETLPWPGNPAEEGGAPVKRRALAPGSYELMVSTRDGRRGVTRLDVGADATTRVYDVVLPAER